MAKKRSVFRSAAPLVVTFGLLPACGGPVIHPNPPTPDPEISRNPPEQEVTPKAPDTAAPAQPPAPAAP